jgi:putative ABC transport system permease protein
VFYPNLWLLAIVVSVLLCIFSSLIPLFSILPMLPAHTMRPRIPKGGKSIFLERMGFVWNRLSFNTRYALKNSLRNKGRFFAVVLGMCGSSALLLFSLGFYDSIIYTRDKYFSSFASYDIIINIDPFPLAFNHPGAERLDEGFKVLILPVDVYGESYNLAIVENGFDMLNIPAEALQHGIIIPEFFAQRWGARVSDKLKLAEVGGVFEISDFDAVVSAIIPQYLGLMMFTGYDYINLATDEVPAVYNSIFGRAGNTETLSSDLTENDIVFSTIEDDETTFNTVMATMSVLTMFMIACSIILGFTVLYSVGMINLSAREYEYMFMGVMGYPHTKILVAHIKETIIQLALAIPVGFILGYYILINVRKAFGNNSFVVVPAVYKQSYLISALSVIGITAILALFTSHRIKNLDIVEGLKAQDD